MPPKRPVPDAIRAHAEAAGMPRAGHYRVVIFEPDASVTHHDATSLEAARAYAFDRSYETDDDRGPALAYIFDAQLQRVG